MASHLFALACSLSILLLLGFSCYGWGKILSSLLGFSGMYPDSAMPVWLGWSFLLFILEVLHAVFPIDARLVIPLFALGIVFSIPGILRVLQRIHAPGRLKLWTIIAIVLLILGIWVTSRAMLSPANYDSGLYHFNTIRWINTYHIVPGLGNLHGRLAFNQSFFVFAGSLNFFPLFERGSSLANSFLLLLLAGSVSYSLRSYFLKPALFWERHPYFYAADIFILPTIIYLALADLGLASPTPDLASTILQLFIFLEVVHGVAEWISGQRDQTFRACALIILAATAVTVKLSNLLFCSAVIALCFLSVWKTSRPSLRLIACLILPSALLMLVWWGRGLLLSGAPLYPSSLGYVPFDWAVPKDKVNEEANWVYSWARLPGADFSQVVGIWDWLEPWWLRVSQESLRLIYPFIIFVLLLSLSLICILFSFFKRDVRPKFVEWIILVPPLAGLIFWFYVAPAPRFANAVFWLLPVTAALVLLAALRKMTAHSTFLIIFVLVFAIVNFKIATYPYLFRKISTSGWRPIPKVSTIKRKTDSGLTVYVPRQGDQCWDSRIPSTPNFNPNLRLRTPGKIANGFTVAPAAPASEADK